MADWLDTQPSCEECGRQDRPLKRFEDPSGVRVVLCDRHSPKEEAAPNE